MIKVNGSDSLSSFINLNNFVLENIFSSNIYKKKINLIIADSDSEFKNPKKNNSNVNNDNELVIYIINKRNKKKINQKYLFYTIFYPIKPHEFLNLIQSYN